MDDEAFLMTYPPPPLYHYHPDAYHIPKYHKQLDQSQILPQPVFSQKGLQWKQNDMSG
jgi:hypothetical protein